MTHARPKRYLSLPPATLSVWLLACLSIVPELVLTGADLGIWGDRGWRLAAYQYGGFWSGLLIDWRPNYPMQSIVMFVTYGFLHGGVLHLFFNVMALLSLGPVLAARLGEWWFLGLYATSQLIGALVFAGVGPVDAPMIGASGALFGLAGAWLADRHARRARLGMSTWPTIRVVLWLVAINAALWWALAGSLAWETHLGGFIAGWGFLRVFGRR